jgi:NADH:ubiquinone oxidoreductase subunit 6 (subunit J)
MTFQTFIFYFFAAVLLFAALRVITARNPVHAALFLVLAFFTSAAIWLLLQAEFLAIALVLVYVGAVMVLFLFVVMMLDINVDALRAGFWKHFPLAATVGAGALSCGQWPTLSISTNSLPAIAACMKSPTLRGALTSSVHCRIRAGGVDSATSAGMRSRSLG